MVVDSSLQLKIGHVLFTTMGRKERRKLKRAREGAKKRKKEGKRERRKEKRKGRRKERVCYHSMQLSKLCLPWFSRRKEMHPTFISINVVHTM
jgi:hypothetical protein